MKMKNNKKEAGAPAPVSESSELYSQNVEKTLLQVPKDRGTHGVEGCLSMPCRCTTQQVKEMTDRCSFYFSFSQKARRMHGGL
jgi:hypothetical protein